jgi:hypothetical protein
MYSGLAPSRRHSSPNSRGVNCNDLSQFRDSNHQVILWPAQYKTGNIIYPYQDATRK